MGDASPVIRELDRRLRGKAPRHELLLILEGGGMRGIQQAAALWSLNQAGATEAFDEIWAVSAGACNAAYFLAGASDRVGRIYSELLGEHRLYEQLLNPLLRRPRPLEIAMGEGIREVEPLDWERVFANPTQLHIGAVDVHSGRPHYFGKGTRADLLMERIRASSQVPTLNGPPVRVGGRRYLDGGLADPLPLRPLDANPQALAVVLHTWPRDHPSLLAGRGLRLLQGTLLHAFHPELVGYHRNWASRRQKQRARCVRLEQAGRVLNWWPPSTLSATCTDAQQLRAAWRSSLRSAEERFSALA